MNILGEIIEHKRQEVAARKAVVSLEHLHEQAARYFPLPFHPLFSPSSPSIIAEIKPKSPSKGVLITRDPLETARLYETSKAGAVSILTDAKYFDGSNELLMAARLLLTKPILRKDFIIDEYQIVEARAIGADAVLLIACCLTQEELSHLNAFAKSFNLGVLIEVHDESDLSKALAADAELIGINNRNLDTLEISLDTTDHIARLIPQHIPFISESGIETKHDAERVKNAGASGILVGTSILKAPDPMAQLELLYAGLN